MRHDRAAACSWLGAALFGGALLLPACTPVAGPGAEAAPAASGQNVECPAASVWDGTSCVRTQVVTKVDCPAGSSWDGTRCMGSTTPLCPAGTRFEAGSGCVSDATSQAADTPVDEPSFPDPSSPAAPSSIPRPIPTVPSGTCGCAPNDLMCLMKCSATCRPGTPQFRPENCAPKTPPLPPGTGPLPAPP